MSLVSNNITYFYYLQHLLVVISLETNYSKIQFNFLKTSKNLVKLFQKHKSNKNHNRPGVGGAEVTEERRSPPRRSNVEWFPFVCGAVVVEASKSRTLVAACCGCCWGGGFPVSERSKKLSRSTLLCWWSKIYN